MNRWRSAKRLTNHEQSKDISDCPQLLRYRILAARTPIPMEAPGEVVHPSHAPRMLAELTGSSSRTGTATSRQVEDASDGTMRSRDSMRFP